MNLTVLSVVNSNESTPSLSRTGSSTGNRPDPVPPLHSISFDEHNLREFEQRFYGKSCPSSGYEENIIYETPSPPQSRNSSYEPHRGSPSASGYHSPHWTSGVADFASTLYNHFVPFPFSVPFPPPALSSWTFVVAGWVMVPPGFRVWPSWVAA